MGLISWLLKDSVTIGRPTTTTTQYGGASVTLTPVTGPNQDGSWPCRVSPRLPRVSTDIPVDDDKETVRAIRVCYFENDANVKRGDIITFGAQTFRVMSTVFDSNGTYLRADGVWTEPGS